MRKSSIAVPRRAVACRLCWTWLVWLFAACAAQAASPTYTLAGRVVRVADGDTLTLLISGVQHRIRLASIDAPETGHGRKRPNQPYGEASRRSLSGLVAGKSVVLRCYERDHYGRDVCDVPLEQGRTASQVQVATGMAWANLQGGGKYLRDRGLLAMERRARDQRLGLWRDKAPVPPWEWRRECWKALESGNSTPIC
jgi:endonuclease YncB( thermonuclease family)